MRPEMNEHDFQLCVVQALARLETQMKMLIGDGQPGRIGQIEKRVRKLELGVTAHRAEHHGRSGRKR